MALNSKSSYRDGGQQLSHLGFVMVIRMGINALPILEWFPFIVHRFYFVCLFLAFFNWRRWCSALLRLYTSHRSSFIFQINGNTLNKCNRPACFSRESHWVTSSQSEQLRSTYLLPTIESARIQCPLLPLFVSSLLFFLFLRIGYFFFPSSFPFFSKNWPVFSNTLTLLLFLYFIVV